MPRVRPAPQRSFRNIAVLATSGVARLQLITSKGTLAGFAAAKFFSHLPTCPLMFENVARKIKRGVRRDGKRVGNAWPSCSGDASRSMWRGKQGGQPEPDIVGFSSGELIDVMMIKTKPLPPRSMYPFRISMPQLSRVRPMPWSKFSRSNDGPVEKNARKFEGWGGRESHEWKDSGQLPGFANNTFCDSLRVQLISEQRYILTFFPVHSRPIDCGDRPSRCKS